MKNNIAIITFFLLHLNLVQAQVEYFNDSILNVEVQSSSYCTTAKVILKYCSSTVPPPPDSVDYLISNHEIDMFVRHPYGMLDALGCRLDTFNIVGLTPGAFDLKIKICTGANYLHTLNKKINVDGGSSTFFDVYFPNAFSPNGDELNDEFKGSGLNISDYHLEIFDRWGELVFETEDINKGWDGSYKGRKAMNGLYGWMVDYKTNCSGNRSIRKSGNVLVLK